LGQLYSLHSTPAWTLKLGKGLRKELKEGKDVGRGRKEKKNPGWLGKHYDTGEGTKACGMDTPGKEAKRSGRVLQGREWE